MNGLIQRIPPVFFPIFFVVLWLSVCTILGLISGWFRLMARYPDQSGQPSLRITRQSGTMGGWVSMSGVLNLSVCAAGLRVGIMRVFGPFSRDFFVPWEDIAVVRKTIIVWPVAEIKFGNPVIGKLRISADVADRLARAALGRWPEKGPFPEARHGDIFRSLFKQWIAATCVAALFFTLAPLALAPSGSHPPILVAVLFPAVVFGMSSVVRYILRTRS